MRAMPSPKGTNHARLYLSDGAVSMALDARPRRLGRDVMREAGTVGRIGGAMERIGADDGPVQEALMEDLGNLKEKIPEALFADLQAALADFYTVKFKDDLDQAEEEIESGEAFVGDRSIRRLQSMVVDGVAKYRAKERERAMELVPGLARIRVL